MTERKAIWDRLLSTSRCRETDLLIEDRPPFDRDFDRIINCSNFRRLKDKTQVFPLSRNDFVRNRLTHSMEVACIGRTLGWQLRTRLSKEFHVDKIDYPDIGTLVAAACLAHDIGNPPFGHSGEYAIQQWARKNVCFEMPSAQVLRDGFRNLPHSVESERENLDLRRFDGNAQSFRVVSRIQTRRRVGGLQLTFATLGAMIKYPCNSVQVVEAAEANFPIHRKKCGYFVDDEHAATHTFDELGVGQDDDGVFRRHPLSYLVEAADDISNAVVDLEDAVDQELISEAKAIELLMPLAIRHMNWNGTKYNHQPDERQRLRAYATSVLTEQCTESFARNEESILAGQFNTDLIASSDVNQQYEAIRTVIKDKVFTNCRVLEIEVAGFRAIAGLLEAFVPTLLDNSRGKEGEKLLGLFPLNYLRQPGDESIFDEVRGSELKRKLIALDRMSRYQRILAVTDYISGMTDAFAVDLYQKLSGIRLPS